MYQKIVFIFILICSSMPSYSKEVYPILGVYVDSFAGVTGKIGFAYDLEEYSFEKKDKIVRADSWGENKFFSDVEFGTDASKVTLGIAQTAPFSMRRLGFVMAKKSDDDFVGAEFLVSAMGISFKFGVLHNLETSNQHVFIGFGIGS